MTMATGPPKPLARCGVATRSLLPQRLACHSLASRHRAGPGRPLLTPTLRGTPGYSPVATGAAAAISIPLQPGGDGASHNGAAKPAPAAHANGNGSSSKGSSSGHGSSVYNTVAAAVAAQFPAVPPLPAPPSTANLSDVVPYL